MAVPIPIDHIMDRCRRCGSFAINPQNHGRDGTCGDLCDVCYWREKAEILERAFEKADKLAMRLDLQIAGIKEFISEI